MDMVWHAFYLAEGDIVVARNGSEDFFGSVSGVRVSPDLFSVFCAPNKMIPKVVSCVGGLFYGHNHIISQIREIFRTIADIPSDSPMPSIGAWRGLCQAKLFLTGDNGDKKIDLILIF